MYIVTADCTHNTTTTPVQPCALGSPQDNTQLEEQQSFEVGYLDHMVPGVLTMHAA